MAVNNNSILEYKCVICLQLLIEPVVLPCKHEMCRPCFRTNVEQANFVCPMCRRRISSWARKGIREGTLVDQNRWNLIQKLFPEKCLKRLRGSDDESEDELYPPPPKRVLAKSGELRQEYEQEMNKILQLHEEEEKASKDLIKNILEQEETLRLKQTKDDEILARKLSEELKETQDNQECTSNSVRDKSTTGDNKSMNFKESKKKKITSRCKGQRKSLTLDKYFSIVDKKTGSSSDASTLNNNVPNEEQHKSDHDLALALQKKFDQEMVDANKRDEYMLRKTASVINYSYETQESVKKTTGKHKDGHSFTRAEQLRSTMLQISGQNALSDEEKSSPGKRQIQSTAKQTQLLRDRTVSTGNHEL